MNISLTKTLEQFVYDQVKTGEFRSASEVVREGLRLLEQQHFLNLLRNGPNPLVEDDSAKDKE